MKQGKDHAILTLPAFQWKKWDETGPAFLVAELGGKKIEVFFFYRLNEDEKKGGKDPNCTYFWGPHGKLERLLVSADSVENWTRQYCLFEVKNGSFECWQIKTHDRQNWMWPLWIKIPFQVQDGIMRIQRMTEEDRQNTAFGAGDRRASWGGRLNGRILELALFHRANEAELRGALDPNCTYATGPYGQQGCFAAKGFRQSWLNRYCLFETEDGILSCYRISAYDQASGLITWEPVSLEVLDEKES